MKIVLNGVYCYEDFPQRRCTVMKIVLSGGVLLRRFSSEEVYCYEDRPERRCTVMKIVLNGGVLL